MPPRRRSWKSPDGTTKTFWMADFTFKYPDGTTVRVRERSPVNTKDGAREFERLRRVALLAGPVTPAKVIPTFKEFTAEFLTEAKNNNKASTLCAKESILKAHLKPAFDALRLDKIDAAAIENYKALKLAGAPGVAALAPKSINNHLIALKRLLSLAVERGVLPAAPKVKHLKLPPQTFVYLDFDECERFLAAAAAAEWKAMLTVAVKTGLRIGELLELKWEDVDLVAGRIIVRRNIWRHVVDTPKGGRIREVPMLSGELVAALKAHRHLKGPYVFCQADGSPFTADTDAIQSVVPATCKKAGLAKRITWHDCRHTFASHLVMRGVPLLAVKEYLGHVDIKTTQIYAHLAPTAHSAWANVLDGGAVTLDKMEEAK